MLQHCVAETEWLTTSIGDVGVHVSGEGPSIVFLHANPGSCADFASVASSLAEGYRVVSVDWPGYGASPAPSPECFEGALSYAAVLIDVLSELSDRRGWAPFVLVGNSVGGYAALRAAAARPDLVAGLVLIAPGGFTASAVFSRFACRVLGDPPFGRKLAVPLAHLYLRRRTPATVAALGSARSVRDDPARARVFSAVWRSFLRPEHDLRLAGRPSMRVLLTWGRWDPVLCAFTDGRRAAAALGVARHTFNSGHEPHAEVPAAWLAVVAPFLASLPRHNRAWSVPCSVPAAGA